MPRPLADDVAGVRLASWNVESIRAHHDQVIGWCDRVEPDVLCMQETRADARRFPRSAFEARGYELVIFGGEGGRAGVAVASRLPLNDVVLGIPGAVAPLDDRRSISLTVPIGGGELRLHTCYAPNGRKVGLPVHEVKLAWFALFAAWLDMDREDHVDQLVLGDLNIAPTDIDIWDASRYRQRNLTSPKERAAFDALLADGALVDVARMQFGDERVYSWWNRRSDFYESDRGWRLDHVLATPGVADRVATVAVDRAERGHIDERKREVRRQSGTANESKPNGADHAPLVLELAHA